MAQRNALARQQAHNRHRQRLVAKFCQSAGNWGSLPGGMVSKMVSDTFRPRDAMFYACTGRTFNGKEAAAMGMVNYSVPLKNLRRETLKLARELLQKNPNVLRATKHAIRATQNMDWRAAAGAATGKAPARKAPARKAAARKSTRKTTTRRTPAKKTTRGTARKKK